MRRGIIGLGLLGWIGLIGCGQVAERESTGPTTGPVEVRQTKVDSTPNPEQRVDRRMVFHASLSLEVSDFDRWARSMAEKVDELGAYISQHREHRYSTDQRMASWTIRVPSTRFSALLGWLDESSTVKTRQVTSKDRTEEYVDIQARIASKKETLNRMKELFANRSQSLPDVLAGEKEIDRVGQELERMEGQLKLLEDQTAMSTIELQVSTPLASIPVVQLSFLQRWEKSLSSSWLAFVQVGQWLLIVLTASLPWTLSAIVLWLIGSRGYRYWVASRAPTSN
jgi:hypothetical protein